MINLRSILFSKKKSPFKLVRTDDNRWMVTKKFSILYMGSKEMCEKYIQNQMKTVEGWDTNVA